MTSRKQREGTHGWEATIATDAEATVCSVVTEQPRPDPGDADACQGHLGLGILPLMSSSKLVRTERAIALFAETLFSTESGLPPRDRIDGVVESASALLAATTVRSRLMFQVCLFAMLWVAPLFIYRAPGLGRLPLGQRVAALTAMEHSPTGAAMVLAIKAVLCMLWYEHPEAAAEVGADPPCVPGIRRSLPVLGGGVS